MTDIVIPKLYSRNWDITTSTTAQLLSINSFKMSIDDNQNSPLSDIKFKMDTSIKGRKKWALFFKILHVYSKFIRYSLCYPKFQTLISSRKVSNLDITRNKRQYTWKSGQLSMKLLCCLLCERRWSWLKISKK